MRQLEELPLPHLLLVEQAGEKSSEVPPAGALDRVMSFCVNAGVPSVLWVTAPGPIEPEWLARSARFDRVFTVDDTQLPDLEKAGARAPLSQQPATALPVDDGPVTDTASRPHPVVWTDGWNGDWPREARRILTSVLSAAAEHGLKVFGPRNAGELPRSLRRCVAGETWEHPEQIFGQARICICAESSICAWHVLPASAFDAIACGAAVLTPFDPASGVTISKGRRALVPPVWDHDSAEQAITRFLADDATREDAVRRCREIVAFNHTFHHRIASIASSVGYRVVPDPVAQRRTST